MKRRSRWWLLVPALLILLGLAATQVKWVKWLWPTEPVNLIGPIDYVGTKGLAAYLIHTSDGAILIDAPMEQNVGKLKRSIEARGIKLTDVKYILLSHAHFDHAGGLAALKKATGAQLIVGAGDKSAVETGIPPGETSYGVIEFPPARVDRGINDGETVTLGGVTLTAVATPGHTPGCTSWTMHVRDRGKPLDVLFACSVAVAGNKLVGNRRYPAVAADFRRSLDRLGAMRADVLLPFHPENVDLLPRAKRGALIDRTVLPRMVADARRDFEADLRDQRE